MLQYQLKLAFRNLLKNRFTTIINIVGLSVGIAASLTMFLYAYHQLTYNSNHVHAKKIYMVYKERHLPTSIQITRDTWFPMAASLKEKYSGIEEATHLWKENLWAESGIKKYKIPVTYAMQNLFKVFTFPLTQGDIRDFTSNNHSAILSQQTAEKFFGKEDPIGKTITLNFRTDYLVGGVLKDIPDNSTYHPEIIVASNSAPWYADVKEYWGSSWLETFILLKDPVNKKEMEDQLPDFVSNNMGNESVEHLNLKLTALTDLHNEMTHANTYAYILLAIAFSILVIASINFLNLATARSLARSKEIGIQKILGASRMGLIQGYLIESLLVSFIAMVVAVIMLELFLPYHFVDESFELLYQTQEQLVTVARIFTGVDMILACLGLFALSALILTWRTREIGIRKVMGASVPNIILMLTNDFVRWIVIANIIAWPLTYYLMNFLLKHFAYRIQMGWLVFFGSGLAVLIVAVFSVVYQSVRTALTNPVDSLRYE